jgi:hypothetical protein
MSQQEQDRQAPGLSAEELAAEDALALPPREAMSVVYPLRPPWVNPHPDPVFGPPPGDDDRMPIEPGPLTPSDPVVD